jgi:nucleotide-binding universal stress UspA family protein
VGTRVTSDSGPADVGASVPTSFVVPVDGSDFASRAVTVARRYATTFGGDVVVVTTPHTIDRSTWKEVPAWLAALTSEPSEVPVSSVVACTTKPAEAIVAEVEARPGSAVCMGTHARGPIGSGALGNVAQQVLRRVDGPVLLLGRHCEVDRPARGPIVVAHDGSPAADAILAPVRAWAHACNVPLVLVHAYHPLDVATPVHPDAALEDACRRLGPGARLEVVPSSFAAGAIREYAHEVDASLIALATHGHTGAGALAMGRVASWVTRESPCPVLVVRPTGLAG